MLTFYNPYVIGAISTIGGFLFGSDISSVSAFLAVDAYLEYFHHPDDVTQYVHLSYFQLLNLQLTWSWDPLGANHP